MAERCLKKCHTILHGCMEDPYSSGMCVCCVTDSVPGFIVAIVQTLSS